MVASELDTTTQQQLFPSECDVERHRFVRRQYGQMILYTCSICGVKR